MSLLTAVVLAAGKGTRMRSLLPKVLHKANGKELVSYAIEAAREGGAEKVFLVVGHEAEAVISTIGNTVEYVIQQPQLGTGHAFQIAVPHLPKDCRDVMILCGDTPLLEGETLSKLHRLFVESGASCSILSAVLPVPAEYGRIVRGSDGNVTAIVEAKDADEEQKGIKEINTGTYCFRLADVRPLLDSLSNDNAQNEYYLTDIVEALVKNHKIVNALALEDLDQILGVNDRIQLSEASILLRQRMNCRLMLNGVTIIDPQRTYIESGCKIGIDSIIEPNTYLKGGTVIGENCRIGPNCNIENCTIGDGSQVREATMVDTVTGQNCDIGPYTYIRPGTQLADKVKVGGFVEMKKSSVDTGSKVPHLSYIGDTIIGKDVNIGCGTITCNYDGYNKFQTIIEDDAFIGSNTNLVAPVRIGKKAFIAAGSTIEKDVPKDALGIGRGRQKNVEGWSAKWHSSKIKGK